MKCSKIFHQNKMMKYIQVKSDELLNIQLLHLILNQTYIHILIIKPNLVFYTNAERILTSSTLHCVFFLITNYYTEIKDIYDLYDCVFVHILYSRAKMFLFGYCVFTLDHKKITVDCRCPLGWKQPDQIRIGPINTILVNKVYTSYSPEYEPNA